MKRILFQTHSWLALIAFIPLLVISLSGAVLVFKPEIDRLLLSDRAVLPAGTSGERMSLDALLPIINNRFIDYELGSWEVFDDHTDADRVYLIERGTDEWYKVHLNPYTGDILSTPAPLDHYFTDWLLELHYNFLVEIPGMVFASFIGVFFTLLGITGIYLYWKFYLRFFTLRWNSSLLVYFSDLHKMIGIVASPMLLIVGITGAYYNITFSWHEITEHVGQPPHLMTHRMYNDQLSIQAMHDDSIERIEGFVPTYLLMPVEDEIDYITWFGWVPSNNPTQSDYSSTVTYNAQNGEFMSTFDIRGSGFGWRLVDSFRELHFGSFAGLVSKVLWVFAGLTPLILSITGVTLWARRRALKSRARKSALAGAAISQS